MSDKFDQRLREKLGGHETPFEPADWEALSERLDARNVGSNRRIALVLFGAILLASAVLGGLYQADLRQTPPSTATNNAVPASTDEESKDPSSNGLINPSTSDGAERERVTPLRPLTSPADASNGGLAGAAGSQSIGSEASFGVGSAASSTGNSTAILSAGSTAESALSVAPGSADLAGMNAGARADAGPGANAGAGAKTNATIQASRTAAEASTTNNSTNNSVSYQAGIASTQVTPALATTDQQAAQQSLPDNPNGPALAALLTQQGSSAASGTKANPGNPNQDQWLAILAAKPLFPITPMAATHDPFALPGDRSLAPNKRDITLKKTPVRWALAAGPGLNTALTAFGDGFRPAWDLGVAGEAWFASGAFVSAGLRYGVYRFQQTDVACGDHAAFGLSDAVHCPDAMLGDESLWEIPLQVGYGFDLKKINGRFRVFGGMSARISRQSDYHVEFHGVSAGDTLFFDPVVINVAPTPATGYPENFTYDANALQDLTSISTTAANPGSDGGSSTSRTSFAVELGFGYEQFLAPTISLGIQPRLDIPLSRLPMGEGRAYHLGMNAMLRWYPNWSR